MLEQYDRKRDFDKTTEPASGQPGQGDLRFLVQKHAARRLHYDFRLEIDGVLKSWPVPKGPSLDPAQKRLAVMVEDHPLDYGTFEGVIGHGNYGAGQVIVWDSGTYAPDGDGHLSFGNREEAEERMRQGVEAGKLSFTLRGRKLKGSWTLVKTSRGPKEWLLIKHRDEQADPDRDVLEDDRSVQSGLTIEELKAGRLPDPALAPLPGQGVAASDLAALGEKKVLPGKLKPMMARLLDKPFSHPGWIFEPKLDGFRILAFLRNGKVKLRSRNGLDMTQQFREVADELESQPEEELLLDGEMVALDERGLPDFGLLQNRVDLPKMPKLARQDDAAPLRYYVFDLLHVNGTSLRSTPLSDRKTLLDRVLITSDSVQKVEYIEGDGEEFFQAAVGLGLEGMVAKRRDSFYELGARSGSWLKVKGTQAQEFVVGGYTQGTGARSDTFGALALGYYDDGQLHYAGRVGSGFDRATLAALSEELERLHVDELPFVPDPELAKLNAQWVRPELIVQVKFAQWTADDRLRAPVFTGLRTEVDPRSVRREAADSASSLDLVGPRADEAHLEDALAQLSGTEEAITLRIGDASIPLTNLSKELWPATDDRPAVTKRDMISYYARIGPALLPHLRDRPLTLTRYPDGIHGESFYQKHWGHAVPDFVETVKIYTSHSEGDPEYIMANNLPTIVWLAQVANIEFHPWLSRTVQEPDARHLSTVFTGSDEEIDNSVLSNPDFIVFDLDPYIYSGKEKAGDEPELNRRAFRKTVEVALELKDILDQLSLSSFVKTSGKTGLHIYVPVLRQYSYKIARKTCETIGRFLMQNRPQEVTMDWAVNKRSGKIFLDHNMNVRGKNMASIFSLRPQPNAPVSTPLRWDELDSVYPTDFTIDTVPDRVEAMGDLWAGILDSKHDLSRLLEAD
jgi:bifunctional non-homologous end joining protein LigD